MNNVIQPKVVIVGGGFAGIETAKTLQKRYPECVITLISNKPYVEYYPGLYRLVTEAVIQEVATPLVSIFKRQPVTLIRGVFKTIDPARQTAILDDGREFVYDYLVLALGSETNYFNIPGLPELSYSFKSASEALRLKKHFCDLFASCAGLTKGEIVSKLNVVIVGGGPSGVELAGSLVTYLRHLAYEVGIDPNLVTIDIVEAADRLLPTLPQLVSRAAHKRLRDLGCTIYLNRAVQSEDIEKLTMTDMQVQTTTVIWTAGTRINQAYAAIPNATFDARKRVIVDEHLALPADNHIFIVGDGASTPYSGLAQTAIHNGVYVGEYIAQVSKGNTYRPYNPKKTSFIIPVGKEWAILSSGKFVLSGMIPWMLRYLIDFAYMARLLPFKQVFRAKTKGNRYRAKATVCPVLPDTL